MNIFKKIPGYCALKAAEEGFLLSLDRTDGLTLHQKAAIIAIAQATTSISIILGIIGSTLLFSLLGAIGGTAVANGVGTFLGALIFGCQGFIAGFNVGWMIGLSAAYVVSLAVRGCNKLATVCTLGMVKLKNTFKREVSSQHAKRLQMERQRLSTYDVPHYNTHINDAKQAPTPKPTVTLTQKLKECRLYKMSTSCMPCFKPADKSPILDPQAGLSRTETEILPKKNRKCF